MLIAARGEKDGNALTDELNAMGVSNKAIFVKVDVSKVQMALSTLCGVSIYAVWCIYLRCVVYL